jgi:predicted enzyme related to lactoylglutathione lyase
MAKIWFDHVHIITLDPKKLATFYEKAFGAKITSTAIRPNGGVSAVIDLTGARLLIMTPDPAEKRDPDNPQKFLGLEHFGMRTDDIEAALISSVAEGAKIVQDVTQVRPGTRIAYIMAPENTMIEFVEVK